MKHPTIKYTYFDIPARGEPVRLALLAGGIDFEDERVQFADFPKLKPTLPLGALPTMQITSDSAAHTTTQSIAMLRYVGRLTGLYPSDPMDALRVDEAIDTALDFFNSLFKTPPGADKEALKAAREGIVKVSGERYWGGLEKIIEGNNPGGVYVLGDEKVSIADILICSLYVLIKYDFLDGVPKDALQEYKRMYAIHEKVLQISAIAEHYKKHPFEK